MFANFTIRQSYTIIFILLVFWASIAYYTMNTLIESQSYYAKLINLSGKQRMLSQKSAFFVHRYLLNQEQNNLDNLEQILQELQDNHSYITQNLSLEAKSLYFEEPSNIDGQMQEYTRLITQLSHIKPNSF